MAKTDAIRASDAMYGRRVWGSYKKRATDLLDAFAGVNVASVLTATPRQRQILHSDP